MKFPKLYSFESDIFNKEKTNFNMSIDMKSLDNNTMEEA